MKTRMLPSSGVAMSEVGFGTWTLSTAFDSRSALLFWPLISNLLTQLRTRRATT